MPRFTIITITRNNVQGLEATWHSLHAQNYLDTEWIVVDGASTDSTLEFLKDKPALTISEPDRGIYDAMNKGIDRASGDYLIFMNAGDCFAHNTVLSTLTEALKTNPAFLYADALEGGHLKKARPHKRSNQGMFTHHQAMVYNRAALADLRYDLRYPIAADYDLTLRFLKNLNEADIVYWPHPLCIFEPGGISQRRAVQGRAEQYAIRRTLGLPFNRLIFTAQTLGHALRKTCPPLYRFLHARIMR